MDYTNYNSEAHSKFKQMQTKYKAQISRKGAGLNYEIVMKFRDKQTDDDLNLFLTKDKK